MSWFEDAYQKANLRFDHEKIVFYESIRGRYWEVMMDWEKPIMNKIAELSVKEGDHVEFRLLGVGILKLRRSRERSDEHRVLFYIDGGVLARKQTLRGRLEFRRIESTKVCLVALLDFRPSLPWFVYSSSQALVHMVVMRSFQKYLSTLEVSESRS